MKKYYLLLFLFLALSGFSQKTLLLQKVGSKHRYIFHFGDRMVLSAVNPPRVLAGPLNGMNDSVLYIDVVPVKVQDVVSVKVKNYLPRRIRELLIKGGILYFMVNTINSAISHDLLFTRTDAIVYASLLGGIGITYLFKYRNVPLGGRWKIIVLDQPMYK
ncbi:MAG: hypothetical protein ACM3N9_01895 [Syntrophothermus sp.]